MDGGRNESCKGLVKVKVVGDREAEICSVKKDVAAGDCWSADAGTEDVDNRKALCPVKKADGRALAGQAGRKVID